MELKRNDSEGNRIIEVEKCFVGKIKSYFKL